MHTLHLAQVLLGNVHVGFYCNIPSVYHVNNAHVALGSSITGKRAHWLAL